MNFFVGTIIMGLVSEKLVSTTSLFIQEKD